MPVQQPRAQLAVDEVRGLELHVAQLEQEGQQPQQAGALAPAEAQRAHRRLPHARGYVAETARARSPRAPPAHLGEREVVLVGGDGARVGLQRRRRRAAARGRPGRLARAAQHAVLLPRALQPQPLCNGPASAPAPPCPAPRPRRPALTEQRHVGAGQQLVQHVEVALAARHARAARALLQHAARHSANSPPPPPPPAPAPTHLLQEDCVRKPQV